MHKEENKSQEREPIDEFQWINKMCKLNDCVDDSIDWRIVLIKEKILNFQRDRWIHMTEIFDGNASKCQLNPNWISKLIFSSIFYEKMGRICYIEKRCQLMDLKTSSHCIVGNGANTPHRHTCEEPTIVHKNHFCNNLTGWTVMQTFSRTAHEHFYDDFSGTIPNLIVY